MEISPIILEAIKLLRSTFGGTKVELLSTEMYRLTPTKYTPAGALGVDIKIEGVKTFLGCSVAEDILAYGESCANEIVFRTIKAAYPDKFE